MVATAKVVYKRIASLIADENENYIEKQSIASFLGLNVYTIL